MRPACRNMQVIFVIAVKINFRLFSILMEGVGLRTGDKQIHYILIMETRTEKLHATQRDNFLAQEN